MYTIRLEKQAEKDLPKIKSSPYKDKVKQILAILEKNPYELPCEKLVGDLSGIYSRRINIRHRIVYRVDEKLKSVVIIRMWGHYGDN